MRTFLINLDKDKERLASADAQLRSFSIDYERFPAVYGKYLTPAEKKKNVSLIRSLMTHGIVWTPGQIGCTLSHLFLYKKMIDEGIESALIIEDDVKFSSDLKLAINAVEKFLDVKGRQVVLLSDHRDNVNQRLADYAESVDIIRIGGDICSEAYFITLPAAREIYRVNFPMAVMVDAWARYSKRGHIELYRTEPPFARQNREDFTTNIEMLNLRQNLAVRISWKVWRFLGVVLDNIYFLIAKR